MTKHKYLWLILLQIVFLVSFTVNAAEDYPWEEYKKQKQSGAIANLIDHVRNLYTLPADVSFAEMQQRQDSILYFLSTGGKNGFRKTPATPEERVVLENALLFAGMLAATDPSGELDFELDLGDIRRHFCQGETDEKIETHLAISQRYLVMGRLAASRHIHTHPDYIRMIMSSGYVLPRLMQEFSKGHLDQDLEAEVKSFSTSFTPSLTERVLSLWNEIPKASVAYLHSTDPLKAEDIDALKGVLDGMKNMTRDALAFKIPIKVVSSYMNESRTPSAIAQCSRPLVVILENDMKIIRRTDGTLCGNGLTWGTVLNSFSNSPTTIKETQTNEEILAILRKHSSIVHQFYYGSEGDFDGLLLADVWPEPYVIILPVYAPPSRETPNTGLMRQAKEESLRTCHDCIEKLKLPANMSRFVDNEESIKTLTQIIEKLGKVNVLEENLRRYENFFESLDFSLDFAMMRLSSPMMCRFSDDCSPSRTHGDSILEMFWDTLKTARSGIQKILYLSKPFAAHMYPPKEDFKKEDVPLDALLLNGMVEEGVAEIKITDAVMDIFAKTDFTVITFEDFWIGSNATVRLHLPSDDAVISLYHKSARPSFTLGKFERDEKWHVNIYTPEQSRGTDVCGRLKRARGIYQPKNTRRYQLDLTNFHDSLKHKTFDEHRKPNTAPPVNFMRTPDGKFELKFIAFQKKKKEDGSYSMEDYRAFLPICEQYQREGIAFAAETTGAIQNNIANALYLKSQTLPLEEQGAALKESAEFFEKASRSRHRNADHQIENIKKLYAQWFYQMGEEKSEEAFDQAVDYFRQAIRMIEPLSEADVAIVRNNFGCALLKKVRTMIQSPSLDIAQAKKFLEEADDLFTKAKRDCSGASENQKDIPGLRTALGVKLLEKVEPLIEDPSKDAEVLSFLNEADELFIKASSDPAAVKNLVTIAVIKAFLQQRARGSN